MASTGAVVYIRPRFDADVVPGRSSGAVVYIPFRSVSGIFSDAGVSSEDNLTSAKAMYPGPRVALVDERGFITQPWDRFFRWILNDKLGGVDAPSITDVTNSITAVQAATTSVVETVVAVVDQNSQNAAALDTVREVAQNNSLAGASQIPPVVRTPYRTLEP